MKWASFWYKLFCASIPLELKIIQILFLTELVRILVSWHPSFLSDHFTHMHPVLSVYCYSDPAASRWSCCASLSPLPYTPLCTACTHNELCLIKPVTLDPPTTFCFRHLSLVSNCPGNRVAGRQAYMEENTHHATNVCCLHHQSLSPFCHLMVACNVAISWCCHRVTSIIESLVPDASVTSCYRRLPLHR